MIITYDWRGYLINHLLPEDHSSYKDIDIDRFPGDINWNSFNPRITLVSKPISVDFLRVGKIFLLENDPDDLSDLETPIPIILEVYDYGQWQFNLPEKQYKKAYFYRGIEDIESENIDVVMYSEEFKLIKRFKTPEQREAILANRRKEVFNYLKARAKEIDLATGNTLDLTSKISLFFEQFYLPSARYIQSGSREIIDVLTAADDTWLFIDLPELGTIKSEIIRILESALTIPTQAAIEAEINKYV